MLDRNTGSDTPSVRRRNSCRSCSGERLKRFLSLGPTPLANAFLSSPVDFPDELFYPLDVYFCEDCSLVQLLDVVDPEILFRDYIYSTGVSDTMLRHFGEYASTVSDLLTLLPGDLVVEVASNDGSLLKHFRSKGVSVLGIEPARNIAKLARDEGIETLEQFFGSATAHEIRESHGPARVVIGNNVLAHVDDTKDFLVGAASLIDDQGLVIIEVPYLRDFLERTEYDTVYHEHLCYFSVTSLLGLCTNIGLSMIRVDRFPVHGGTLRLYFGLPPAHGEHAEEVLALAEEERIAGLTSFGRYTQFAADVERTREQLVELLHGLCSSGASIGGYGAPAKGNTLLNYCRIGTDLIPFIVDRSPLKVGRYTPGSHIPVLPVSTLLERQPDYVLLLAWNFADEIMSQLSEYRERGGRFILPIPEPTIVQE